MASSSRVFILLGLMLAIVLLISSEVSAAKDLAAAHTETKEQNPKTNGVEESKSSHGGGGSRGGYCQHGHCRGRCCSYAGEAKDSEKQTTETNGVEESKSGHGGGGSRGGYCQHGHCRGRCCTYADEDKDAQTSTEPQN